MAAEHLTASARGRIDFLATKNLRSIPKAVGPVSIDSTVEVTAAAEVASTYHLARVPSNARIHGLSKVQWDLLSEGEEDPTMDIGLYAVEGNITTDVDALNDGLVIEDAGGTENLIKDKANWGKRAWEFVNAQTSDPGGFLDIKAVLADFGLTTGGGTISLYLLYTVD